MKILIIGPDKLTELVLAQALAARLYHRHQCEIDVFVPAHLKELVSRIPQINATIPLPDKVASGGIKRCIKAGLALRNQGYYQAINLLPAFSYGMIAFLAGIPRRTMQGSSDRYAFFKRLMSNDYRVQPTPYFGRQVDQLSILAMEPGSQMDKNIPPQLLSHDGERQAAMKKHQLAVGEKPILVICPELDGAASKYWPEKHYADIVKKKTHDGWQVWLLGGASDSHIGKKIEQLLPIETQSNVVNLMGRLTLVESIDLLSLADAVLGVDNGLLHVASALNRSVVIIYGPSSPRYRPPLSDHGQVVTKALNCAPCGEMECPKGLSVCLNYQCTAQVFVALDRLPQPEEVGY